MNENNNTICGVLNMNLHHYFTFTVVFFCLFTIKINAQARWVLKDSLYIQSANRIEGQWALENENILLFANGTIYKGVDTLEALPNIAHKKQPIFRMSGSNKEEFYTYELMGEDWVIFNSHTKTWKSLPLTTRWKGKKYDVGVFGQQKMIFLSDTKVLLPMSWVGTKKEIPWVSDAYYNQPIVGLFELKHNRVKLANVYGTRDNMYHQYHYLSYLNFWHLTADNQRCYISEGATHAIQVVDIESGKTEIMGIKGQGDTLSHLPVIQSSDFNQRLYYDCLINTAQYGEIFIDTAHNRLYRFYTAPLLTYFDKDSIRLAPIICGEDNFVNQQYNIWRKKQHFIQVYDLQTRQCLQQVEIRQEPQFMIGYKEGVFWWRGRYDTQNKRYKIYRFAIE